MTCRQITVSLTLRAGNNIRKQFRSIDYARECIVPLLNYLCDYFIYLGSPGYVIKLGRIRRNQTPRNLSRRYVLVYRHAVIHRQSQIAYFVISSIYSPLAKVTQTRFTTNSGILRPATCPSGKSPSQVDEGISLSTIHHVSLLRALRSAAIARIQRLTGWVKIALVLGRRSLRGRYDAVMRRAIRNVAIPEMVLRRSCGWHQGLVYLVHILKALRRLRVCLLAAAIGGSMVAIGIDMTERVVLARSWVSLRHKRRGGGCEFDPTSSGLAYAIFGRRRFSCG